jgi:hypothetical protein
MMRVVLRTASSSPVVGRLEFSDPRWTWYADHSGHLNCAVTVELGDEERSIGIEMIPEYTVDMLGFFEDMAKHVGGWSGVMSWQSEFHEVELHVRNPDGGDVTFDLVLCWPPEYEVEWSGSLVVNSDALPRAAEAMRKLTGLEGGRRFITPNRPRTWQPL